MTRKDTTTSANGMDITVFISPVNMISITNFVDPEVLIRRERENQLYIIQIYGRMNGTTELQRVMVGCNFYYMMENKDKDSGSAEFVPKIYNYVFDS